MALLVAGVVVLVGAFVRFVTEGVGTPAPVAPTQRLVVGGLYRYVRNPMYLAVVATIVGQALALGQPALLGYAVAVGAAMVAFVHGYEEPALAGQFGAQPSKVTNDSWRLSLEGVTLARQVGESLGPLTAVVTSASPRAVETVVAMGFAVDDSVQLPSATCPARSPITTGGAGRDLTAATPSFCTRRRTRQCGRSSPARLVDRRGGSIGSAVGQPGGSDGEVADRSGHAGAVPDGGAGQLLVAVVACQSLRRLLVPQSSFHSCQATGVSTAVACTAPLPYRASRAARARSSSTTTIRVTALADSPMPVPSTRRPSSAPTWPCSPRWIPSSWR